MVVGTVARLDNATVYFGGQLVFEKLSWEVYHDARIGLVGPNGAGKSSILKLLAGENKPNDAESLSRAASVSVICRRNPSSISRAR